MLKYRKIEGVSCARIIFTIDFGYLNDLYSTGGSIMESSTREGKHNQELSYATKAIQITKARESNNIVESSTRKGKNNGGLYFVTKAKKLAEARESSDIVESSARKGKKNRWWYFPRKPKKLSETRENSDIMESSTREGLNNRGLHFAGKATKLAEATDSNDIMQTSTRQRKNNNHRWYFAREVKKLRVDMSILHEKRKKSKKLVITVYLFFLVLLVFACYFWFQSKCCHKSALALVHRPLLHQLYGQSLAIEKMMESFTDNDSNSKITFFYGSTGVGKTYASQIILQHMQDYPNVFHFSVLSRENFDLISVDTVHQLCDFIFIILDDVTMKNLPVEVVSDIVDKTNYLQKSLHLILIYNSDIVSDNFEKTNDADFRKNLDQNFRETAAAKYFVEFNKLEEDHLRFCIVDALLFHNYKVKSDLVDSLLTNFDVTFDGCRGVDSKVKGLNTQKY